MVQGLLSFIPRNCDADHIARPCELRWIVAFKQEGFTPTESTDMKTLAVLLGAAAISLTFAAPASAQFFGGGFGGGGSISVTRSSTDAFGNRQSVTRRISNNGFGGVCRSITRRNSDGFGDSQSRTVRQCS
jgi:hypothetical protein